MSCSILKKTDLSIYFLKKIPKYFCEILKKVLDKNEKSALDKWASLIIIFFV